MPAVAVGAFGYRLHSCQVFHVDDYKMGQNWNVFQKFHHHHAWVVPEILDEGDDNENIVEHGESEAYQESCSKHVDKKFEAMDIEQLNREDVDPLGGSLNDTESEDEPLLNSDEDSDDCVL